jgi:isoquinoline 1-oxidoreductase alpha subunit
VKLTGTKFGCGAGLCGACTVIIDGAAVGSCTTPIASVEGKSITTIEGLAPVETPTPVQAAWIAEQVPQCGYCQSGMIMATTALLAQNPNPSDADIDAAITNICRCGTYVRIRKAIHLAATLAGAQQTGVKKIGFSGEEQYLPALNSATPATGAKP